MSALLHEVSALLDRAVGLYDGRPEGRDLAQARRRLDEPLRVAIAGKVKAGKSTLLNALVGEILAPTDAGECTRIVTWYVDSHTSRVTVEPHTGEARQVPFTREDGAIDVQLGDDDAASVARLVVEWPSSSLRELTLIDTPGIDSLSSDVSARTHAFLTPAEDQETPADAVLYLMRHLHASDLRFLEAFHDEEVAHATPVNAIGVLSRADEIGVGRLDAMESSLRIADRYRRDAQVRRLCQTVVPVAGLLAESACTLRQDEFRAFQLLAAAPEVEVERLLLSADRFAGLDTEVPLDAESRTVLLRRFGVFGIRTAVHLLRSGGVAAAPDLAAGLRRASGLDDLKHVLATQFTARRDILKARAALAAVDSVLRRTPVDGSDTLAADVERVESGAHELAELRLLNALRTGAIELPDGEAAEHLLGAQGTDASRRLGLAFDAPSEEVVAAAREAHSAWRRRAENPMSTKEVAEAASVLARTCEGIVVDAIGRTPPSVA